MPKLPIPYGDQPASPGDVPVEWYDTGETKRTASGLTVRDWLAAQAMSSFLILENGHSAKAARLAYEAADALLAARERPNAAPSTPSS